ncbi:SCP-like protein, partial [Oesophagostomum dentatum]
MNSAKNMYKLKWDCGLERKVDEVIQGCPNSAKVGGHLSQNIVRWNNINGSIIKPSMLVKLTLTSWWKAGERFGVPSSQEYNNDKLTTFANMAYSKASRVGCSYVTCGNSITLSCLYNANIHVGNDPIWETGPACTRGDECTTYGSSGCEDGLCTAGTEKTVVTQAPVVTEAPEAPDATVAPTAETPSASEASEEPEISTQATEAPTTVVFESTTPTFPEAPESTVVPTVETPSASEASEEPEITSQPTEAPTAPLVPESTTPIFPEAPEPTVVPTVETPSASKASEEPEITSQPTEAPTTSV